jgi:hypothetical protein
MQWKAKTENHVAHAVNNRFPRQQDKTHCGLKIGKKWKAADHKAKRCKKCLGAELYRYRTKGQPFSDYGKGVEKEEQK